MSRATGSEVYTRIYSVVRRVPKGRVVTYGAVARLAGLPRGARQVGYALHSLDAGKRDVPWQRVVNSRGEVSLRGELGAAPLQRSMLCAEGVVFDARGRVDLEIYGWPEAFLKGT
ncbi:MAG: MGMT family protein [Myxococcota bacterium]|nr:MGMT family protein [Myxococcota bacterium]